MPSRTARLSKKGCGVATPECRAQRDVAVHPRPAAPAPLLAAPRLSTTALGYLEIRWVVSEVVPGDGRIEQRRHVLGDAGESSCRSRSLEVAEPGRREQRAGD